MQLRGEGRADLKGADAIRYAYRLLSYRDRSEKELRERLRRKGFSEETIQHVISHLNEKGFINDEKLALSLKRVAEEVKLLGTQGIRLFLQRRGLSERIADNVLEDNDSDEVTRAKKLVDKKLRTMGNYSDEEIKKKIWRTMVRKGYSFDTIKQIIKEFKINGSTI